MAPAFLSSAAFLLPFLANLMFLMNLASQPRRDSVLFLEGFLTPLRWAFLFWLWLVWFLDLAIFGGYLLILGICKFDFGIQLAEASILAELHIVWHSQ